MFLYLPYTVTIFYPEKKLILFLLAARVQFLLLQEDFLFTARGSELRRKRNVLLMQEEMSSWCKRKFLLPLSLYSFAARRKSLSQRERYLWQNANFGAAKGMNYFQKSSYSYVFTDQNLQTFFQFVLGKYPFLHCS